jgi:hypothetical protein
VRGAFEGKRRREKKAENSRRPRLDQLRCELNEIPPQTETRTREDFHRDHISRRRRRRRRFSRVGENWGKLARAAAAQREENEKSIGIFRM